MGGRITTIVRRYIFLSWALHPSSRALHHLAIHALKFCSILHVRGRAAPEQLLLLQLCRPVDGVRSPESDILLGGYGRRVGVVSWVACGWPGLRLTFECADGGQARRARCRRGGNYNSP